MRGTVKEDSIAFFTLTPRILHWWSYCSCKTSEWHFPCFSKLSYSHLRRHGGGKWGQPLNRRHTRSWDLRKSDEKHAGRNWGGGAPAVGRIRIPLYCIIRWHYLHVPLPCSHELRNVTADPLYIPRCPLPPTNMLHFFMTKKRQNYHVI